MDAKYAPYVKIDKTLPSSYHYIITGFLQVTIYRYTNLMFVHPLSLTLEYRPRILEPVGIYPFYVQLHHIYIHGPTSESIYLHISCIYNIHMLTLYMKGYEKHTTIILPSATIPKRCMYIQHAVCQDLQPCCSKCIYIYESLFVSMYVYRFARDFRFCFSSLFRDQFNEDG